MNRREFVQGAAATGALAWLPSCRTTLGRGPSANAGTPDPRLRPLTDAALGAARDAGASYADIRIADAQRQWISTREQRVSRINDIDTRGFGVRVIVDGTWGFAASSNVSQEEIVRVARGAVAMARANAPLQKEPVVLAPISGHTAVWDTPIQKDPFAVPLQDKVERLLSVNAEALKHKGVSFCSTWMALVREHKLFASTEGSNIEQTLFRVFPGFKVTSVDPKGVGFHTRSSFASPQGAGYEYIENYPWLADVREAAEDAFAKHSAPSVEPGKRDLILHPSNLWLTIHESIGHPTELDRALGMEANLAGTSFLTTDKLGSYRIGSDIVSLTAERTQKGGLATCGFDDDGAPTTEWPVVQRGIFVDYQTTRDQAHWIGRPKGHACSYAQSWRDVPLQRMPNINLMPSDEPVSLEDLISGTEDGVLVKGRGSYSIDQQRYNFQFSGQTFHEIKSGKVRGPLKDVAYQARTPEFWQACDAVGGPGSYALNGSFFDGKGEPMQSNAVSHGCPPARFVQINILNTSRAV